MARDIAVFVGDDGTTASLYKPGRIIIFHKEQNMWQAVRKKEFVIDKKSGLRGMRKQMEEALQFLADCKIFVALSVTGVPYLELEKVHASIWGVAGKPEEFLDYIMEKEEETAVQLQAMSKSGAVPVPQEIGNGCYQMSIKDTPEKSNSVRFKQALLPFIRKGKFYELEVQCNHIPPWLEKELIGGNLAGKTEKIGNNDIKLIISKKYGD